MGTVSAETAFPVAGVGLDNGRHSRTRVCWGLPLRVCFLFIYAVPALGWAARPAPLPPAAKHNNFWHAQATNQCRARSRGGQETVVTG
jgi:hypothetical protein